MIDRPTNRPALLVACAIAVLLAATAEAQVVRQLTDFRSGVNLPGRLDGSGTYLAYTSTWDPLGSNPTRAFQLFVKDLGTGTTVQLTDDRAGGALTATISDDGDRLAITSRADLTGENRDLSAEVFVLFRDGTGIRQLTSSDQGSSALAVICGDGTRVAFTSSADLTGQNADHSQEVFVVDWDGTGLVQLTDTLGSSGSPTISDDGERIAFLSSTDPTGGNPDGSAELFAVNADGTGLRQLTSDPEEDCAFPWIAGGGAPIAFQSSADYTGGNGDLGDEVFLVDWDGTGLRQLTNSTSLILAPFAGAPSVTDDGGSVFYHSNTNSFLTNIDGNVEIWRINADGSGRTALTSTIIDIGSLLPIASGDGSRVHYVSLASPTGENPDGNIELFSMTGNGANETQETNTIWGFAGGSGIAASGGPVALTHSGDLTGGNPDLNAELFVVAPDGSELSQITEAASGGAGGPSVDDAGSRIAFDSTADYTGGNGDSSREIFLVNPDGTGLVQLTSAPTGDSSGPALSGDGTWIAFVSEADLTGGNADESQELFAIRADGTGLIQLTDALEGSTASPSITVDGSTIAFDSTADLVPGSNPEANREVFLVNNDGSGLTQLTLTVEGASSAASLLPDGSALAFTSSADLAGENADANGEIFVVNADGSGLVQVTDTLEGSNGAPAFADDGSTITFTSSAPFAGPNVDGIVDLWRVRPDGSGLERLTASRFGGAGGVSLSSDTALGPFNGLGDFVGDNPDATPEIFLVDLGAPWSIVVEEKDPTLVAWSAAAGGWAYDVARGNLASLAFSNGDVDLGPLVCIEDDSPDLDTLGDEDPDVPDPGEGFFYVVRYADGLNAPSYGDASGGAPRVPGAGDCIP